MLIGMIHLIRCFLSPFKIQLFVLKVILDLDKYLPGVIIESFIMLKILLGIGILVR
uniref:Uncharacterized protein n=1 Tax=Meloidogyne enterolobii TaxID=390850 RepID=A0A6V7YBG0_MELEN|nr:unnamed protein product [Meloidogyne enterolobii]